MQTSSPSRRTRFAAVVLTVGALAAASLGASACDPKVTFGSLEDGVTPDPGDTTPASAEIGATCTDTIAPVGKTVTGLIEHAGWLYFVEPHYGGDVITFDDVVSDLLRVPVTGGTPEIVVHDAPQIHAVRGWGDRIYWTELEGAVRSSALDGSDVQLLLQTGPEDYAVSLAVTEDGVFIGGMDGSLRTLPLDGGAVSELRGPTADSYPNELQVDASNVYFVDSHFSTADVSRVSVQGGPVEVLVPGSAHLGSILLHGDSLFVAQYGEWMQSTEGQPAIGVGAIHRIDLTGAAPMETLAENQPFPSGLAIDDSGLYWGGGGSSTDDYGWDAGPGSLVYVHRSRDGGPAEPVSRLTVVYSMVPCDGAMCWINQETHEIERYRECVP